VGTDIDIGFVASFGAGLVSFLSPCILPLVPSYLCFLAGASLSDLTADKPEGLTGRVLARAVAFVLGFTCVFVALGASASTVGRLVSEHLTLLSRVAGIVIIVLGLHMAGLFRISMLMREARFQPTSRPAGAAGAFAVGLAFGFGWTPCVGPILASILLLAGSDTTVGRGAALLAAYAAGIGVPFIAAALFTRPFLAFAARFRAHLSAVEKAMGLVLVGTGVLVFVGAMPVIGGWLLDYVPFLGRIG
jgi:cytochrome c-type biogenesis protein